MTTESGEIAVTIGAAAARDATLDVSVRPTILFEGERYRVREGLVVGSSREADIVLPPGVAAAMHARIYPEGDHMEIRDESGIGLLLNGNVVQGQSATIDRGDRVTIGGQQLLVGDAHATRRGAHAQVDKRIVIGSSPNCDVVVDHPTVSPVHATVEVIQGRALLRVESVGGSVTIDGTATNGAELTAGTEFALGSARLIFDGSTVIPRRVSGERLDAIDVSRRIGDRVILHPTTFTAQAGELVAIIGESGAGKTTFLKMLAATEAPDSGSIVLGGEPAVARRAEIGYVPQDEIVHGELTVSEALTYAAELRLPQDVGAARIASAVSEICVELGLTEQRETMVANLSGGQRKRTGVATELIHQPAVLLLDEPTTGLDPGLERKAMELFRRLASGPRPVVLVTHATKNLSLCDKVLILATGGHTCFFGTPADALRFFDVEEFDQIYGAIDTRPGPAWTAELEARPDRVRDRGLAELAAMAGATAPSTRAKSRRSRLRETSALVSRYAKVFVRDRRNLILLLGQAPVLGLLAALIFPIGALHDTDRTRDATNLIFLLTTISVWLGAISASREIVRERALLFRETAVGVRVSSYLFSKLLVLGTVVTVQVALMTLAAFVVQPPDASLSAIFGMFGCFLAAAWTSLCLGLMISAYATTENQATTLIPLALIPQLLLGGAIVAVASMSGVVQAMAGLTFSRWFFAGGGTAYGLDTRIPDDPVFSRASEYGAKFFDLPPVTVPGMLLLFSATFIAITAALIKYRDMRVSDRLGA